MDLSATPKIDASRARIECHFVCNIPVGGKALVSIADPLAPRDHLPTIFVGQEKGKYIILRLTKEILATGLLIDTEVTVRYMLNNYVFGLVTYVKNMITKPYPLLFLKYPECVEILDMRHENRVACTPPLAVDCGGKTIEGRMLDLSVTGCRFVAKQKALAVSLNVGARLTCSLNLEGRERSLAIDSKVRSASLNADKIFVGVEFLNLTEADRSEIDNYVRRMREYAPD